MPWPNDLRACATSFPNLSPLFWMFLISITLQAQAPASLEQGFRAYGSYEGSDIDSVNLSSGSLELHIPLLSYPQRGNLAISFSARASAKNWMVHQEFNQGGSVIASVMAVQR
jgi:hypothetical protein